MNVAAAMISEVAEDVVVREPEEPRNTTVSTEHDREHLPPQRLAKPYPTIDRDPGQSRLPADRLEIDVLERRASTRTP